MLEEQTLLLHRSLDFELVVLVIFQKFESNIYHNFQKVIVN